jgi:hypothetical protein
VTTGFRVSKSKRDSEDGVASTNRHLENYFIFLGVELREGEFNVFKPPDQNNRLIIPFLWVVTATCLKIARAIVCTVQSDRTCNRLSGQDRCLGNFSLTLIARTSYRLGVRRDNRLSLVVREPADSSVARKPQFSGFLKTQTYANWAPLRILVRSCFLDVNANPLPVLLGTVEAATIGPGR